MQFLELKTQLKDFFVFNPSDSEKIKMFKKYIAQIKL